VFRDVVGAEAHATRLASLLASSIFHPRLVVEKQRSRKKKLDCHECADLLEHTKPRTPTKTPHPVKKVLNISTF
jgi:hypothetical protein